jgi:D-3-phosphoglycerate dehydrogenase
VGAATDLGIVVANTPEPLAEEVSDHSAALLLDCARGVAIEHSNVRRGKWRTDTSLSSSMRMRGKTLGLIGFGRVARRLVEKLAGFKLKYLACDPYVDSAIVQKLGVELVSMEELLTRSDFVSIHTQLTAETHQLLGEKELRMMKSHAILINTARGAIVDQKALHEALSLGWIARAGLDVLEQEPPAADDPLLQLDNVVLTPHIAAASGELMDALYTAGLQVTIELLNGGLPASVVNPEVDPWWMSAQRGVGEK